MNKRTYIGSAGWVLMGASVVAVELGGSLSLEIISIVFGIGLFCFFYAAVRSMKE